MKIRRPLFFAVVAATAVSLASMAVSAGAAETPFKGTVNAAEVVVVTPPTASVTRDGTGTATYLGKYTEHTLTATVDGQATPTTTPGVLSIVEVYTITGGTGRFADTGTFTLHSTVNQATGISTGTLSGVIDH
jgi:hypothetical protein